MEVQPKYCGVQWVAIAAGNHKHFINYWGTYRPEYTPGRSIPGHSRPMA